MSSLEDQRVTLPRVSTTEALVIALRGRILNGSLPPGTRLGEVALAEAHGVSRQSLRAALVELAHRGLAEARPHRGVRVRKLGRDDIDDLYRVREVLEGSAIRQAAVDPGSWPAIERAIERLERFPFDTPWIDVIDTDIDFHRALVAAAHSVRLSRIHAALEGETCLSFMRSDGDDPANVARLHRRLYEAIRSGDPDAAFAELQRHLDLGRALVLRSI